jgi:uncharacterized protein
VNDIPAFPTFVAFLDGRRIALGHLPVVAKAAKQALDAGAMRPVQVFDAETGEPWDLDLGGTVDEVEARYRLDDIPFRPGVARRAGPGRPKLGVVAREITLLPRHWDWLNEQPGGASAALRRLVDSARATHAERDAVRRAQERSYRFMASVAGDAPGFEEAARALFARDRFAFAARIAEWSSDIQAHLQAMVEPVFRS